VGTSAFPVVFGNPTANIRTGTTRLMESAAALHLTYHQEGYVSLTCRHKLTELCSDVPHIATL
jgi:hypothetical protein